jgi:mono/diheme cytochrome c family protein
MKKFISLFAFSLITISFMSFQQKPKFDLKASVARGQEVYTSYCVSCHQEKGEGIEDVYPPLAKSDYLTTDKKRLIQMILHGATGEMKVNGKTYNGEMTGFDLTDQEVSDVLNYVKNSFGNKGDAVKPEDVKAAR